MGDDDARNEVARLKAEFDQAKEGIRQVPGLLWVFFSEAVAEGFSEEQAMMLTLEYMNITCGGSDE